MIFKIYNWDFLSVSKKEEEIHKTPANSRKIWWEFAGVFHKFLNAQNEHFFTKKHKFTKLPLIPRDYQLPPYLSDVH